MEPELKSALVDVADVGFIYKPLDGPAVEALSGVSFRVRRGESVVVLGRNGSGKSTLARLLNALEIPDYGRILIAGYDTANDEFVFEIRRRCGMVFQNPDNQIVGTTVEEDVAFGPENLGVPLPELAWRVERTLETVALENEANRAPSSLSGGQKQKLAIAGVLAMEPDCIVLDEATSMLDPVSRNEFIRLIDQLRHQHGLTILNITHDIQEAMGADRLIILDEGKIVVDDRPPRVFHQLARVRSLGLDAPFSTSLGILIGERVGKPLTEEETSTAERTARAIVQRLELLSAADLRRLIDDAALSGVGSAEADGSLTARPSSTADQDGEIMIDCQNLSFFYEGDESIGKPALRDVSFQVKKGELFGIMGQTGSGKSTLVQHLNGLLRPQTGTLTVLGHDLSKASELRRMRQHVGLLFQYPEHQLFAETVGLDIAFGPQRMKLDPLEVEKRVREAGSVVGFDADVLRKSPFELSGGQKRRAALAGVLAMKPRILVLDEPAAGLDPLGKAEIFSYINHLNQTGVTVILVSHDMDDLARLADRILVLKDGEQKLCGEPDHVFAQTEILRECQLTQPVSVSFLRRLSRWLPELDVYRYTVEESYLELLNCQYRRAIENFAQVGKGAE